MFSLDHLPNQQADEKILILLRRHGFILLKFILFFAALAGLPLLFYFFFSYNWPTLFSEQLFFYTIGVLFFSLYYLSIWLLFFYSFLDYYLDIWIVTNHRIINIEQKGLFNRVISEQKLDRIQDVTSEVKGIIPTLFDYGNVYIQTAAEKERFIFKQIPRPAEIRRKILTLAEHEKHFQKIISQEN